MSTGPDISFETERLLFRRFRYSDAMDLFKTTGDVDVMRYWGAGADKTESNALKRIQDIEDHWGKHGFGDWAVLEKEGGELIGFCGLHYIDGMSEVNIGYALKKQNGVRDSDLKAAAQLLLSVSKNFGWISSRQLFNPLITLPETWR